MRDKSGEYTLLRKIGRGGMGQVWAGVRRDLTMPCAIKVLHPDLAETDKDRHRFLNEARIAAQLDHGRIVKVIDTGELNGSPFLVMDWVDGVNLRQFVAKAREASIPRLDLSICSFIVGEVLAALQYAHNRTVAGHDAGVIHYDVTPGNILISSSGEVKLTDFGIARFAATAGPISRSVGTPRYMSAEQITGHPLRETDIYSLGVVFYELIEGVRYLDGFEPDQFRARVLLGPPPELTRPDTPDWLRRLVHQMLAVRPEERPSASAARTVICDNAVGYPAASRKLQVLYKSLVGEARSGLTQLVELGESAENYGVSAGAIEASERKHIVVPLEVPGGQTQTDAPPRSVSMPEADRGQARGSATLTGVPQRQTPPEPVPESEDEIEPTVELPMEDALQPNPPRVTLPMMLSRPQPPPRGQPLPRSTPSSVPTASSSPAMLPPQQVSSATATAAPAAEDRPSGQRALVYGLGVMVLALTAALIWIARQGTDDAALQPAEPAILGPPSSGSVLANGSPSSSETGDETTGASPDDETEPVVDTEPNNGGDTVVDAGTETGPDEEARSDAEPETNAGSGRGSKPTPKPAANRQKVVFLPRDGKSNFELEIGSKKYGPAPFVQTNLKPGKQKICWRPPGDKDSTTCDELEVVLLEGTDYFEVKVGAGKLDVDLRRKGGG